jgi:hypothetical protein
MDEKVTSWVRGSLSESEIEFWMEFKPELIEFANEIHSHYHNTSQFKLLFKKNNCYPILI